MILALDEPLEGMAVTYPEDQQSKLCMICTEF